MEMEEEGVGKAEQSQVEAPRAGREIGEADKDKNG